MAILRTIRGPDAPTADSEHALCMVSAPGSATATVTVDDQHAHVVSASGTAPGSGHNRLPDVSIGYISVPLPLRARSSSLET